MADIAILVFFSLLPAAVFLGISSSQTFFLSYITEESAPKAPRGEGRSVEVTFLALSVLVVPAFLLLLSQGVNIGYIVAFLCTSFSACWAAWCLWGRIGAAAVLALIAINFFGIGAAGGQLWLFNLLAIFAALGAAQLIQSLLSVKMMIVFLVGLVVLDCLLVGSGLLGSALSQMPLPGLIEINPGSWPLYNRVVVDYMLLGAGDLAYAGLLAALAWRYQSAVSLRLATALVYIAAQATLIYFATQIGEPLPATLSGLVALLGFFVLNRYWPGSQSRASS
jgi:hypothetical protein